MKKEWDGTGSFEFWCAQTLIKLAEEERINPDKYEGFNDGDLGPITDDEEDEFGVPGGGMDAFGAAAPAVAWQPNEMDQLPGTPMESSNPLSDTLPGTPLTQEEPPPMPGASGSRPGSRRVSEREVGVDNGDLITPVREGSRRSSRGSRRGSERRETPREGSGVQETFSVKVVRCVGLLNISQDIGWDKGTSDPCVKAELRLGDGTVLPPEGDPISPRVTDSLNPEFNHTFTFLVDRSVYTPGPGYRSSRGPPRPATRCARDPRGP